MNLLSHSEEQALRYYIGDVSGNDPFFGDPKAYVTINSLFFPDISSETARAAEGKWLNPAIISNIPRLMGFFEPLFSAFGKARLDKPTSTYRVERMSDFNLCRQRNMTISMTSTSLAGFLNAYRDRRGIALMRFSLPKDFHCIDAAKTLGFYAKSQEAEILLPPFIKLEFTELPLSDNERKITDCDGNPPIISVKAKLSGIEYIGDESCELDSEGKAAGIRVYAALNGGTHPTDNDIKLYTRWKLGIQSKLNKMLIEYCQ